MITGWLICVTLVTPKHTKIPKIPGFWESFVVQINSLLLRINRKGGVLVKTAYYGRLSKKVGIFGILVCP